MDSPAAELKLHIKHRKCLFCDTQGFAWRTRRGCGCCRVGWQPRRARGPRPGSGWHGRTGSVPWSHCVPRVRSTVCTLPGVHRGAAARHRMFVSLLPNEPAHWRPDARWVSVSVFRLSSTNLQPPGCMHVAPQAACLWTPSVARLSVSPVSHLFSHPRPLKGTYI